MYTSQTSPWQDAGYSYVNIDDCWAEKNRSASGDLVPGASERHLRSLATYVHSQPVKIKPVSRAHLLRTQYGDSGWFTCAGYPGSWGNEVRDATTFVEWGYDYLKYDNCAIPFDDITRVGIVGKYQRMSDAIAQVAKSTNTAPMVFSLCEWGWDLWAHTDNGTAIRNFTANDVPPHGVVALLLNDAGNEPDGIYPLCSVWDNCSAENGTATDG
ncbi:hypothetical protein H0H92_008423 [Tricholoma furcatifolium]|nr:hypothetical protein H0H92_008423 [Tricholoma furcatifolium]